MAAGWLALAVAAGALLPPDLARGQTAPGGYTVSNYKTGLPDSGIAGLAIDPATRTLWYATQNTAGVLRKIAPDLTVSTVTSNFGSSYGPYDYGSTDLEYHSGAIYTTQGSFAALKRINADGSVSLVQPLLSAIGNTGTARRGSVIYSSYGNRLNAYDLNTSTNTVLSTTFPSNSSNLEYDPLHDRFVMAGYGNGFYRFTTSSLTPTTISSISNGHGNFAVSPTGDQMYFRNFGSISVLNVTGGSATTFSSGYVNGFFDDIKFGPSSSGRGYSLYTTDTNRVVEIAGFAIPTLNWIAGTGNWSTATNWMTPTGSAAAVAPNNNASVGLNYLSATINSGTVTLDQNASIELLNMSGGTLVVPNTLDLNYLTQPNTIGSAATLQFSGGTVNVAAQLQLLGQLTSIASTTGALLAANNVTLEGGSRTITVADGAAATDLEIQAAILNGTGSGSLVKQGAGLLKLTGSLANSYSGSTTVEAGTLVLAKPSGTNAVGGNVIVNGGTLQLTNHNQIPNSSTVTVHGGTFDAQGVSETVASISVGAGGTLLTDGLTILTAATINTAGNVVVDGTLNAVVTQTGGLLSGSGQISGDLHVLGGTLSPGNSPGTMSVVGNVTWGPSGTELIEVNDALGTSGADPGWDLLDATGTLTITATAGNEFTLDVDSLTLANAPGNADNFNPANSYSWTFASAVGGIVGFDPAAFLLDLSGFTNPYTGTFSVAQLGSNLNLLYTPPPAAVPEPGTLVIWSLLGTAVGAGAWRRRRQRAR